MQSGHKGHFSPSSPTPSSMAARLLPAPAPGGLRGRPGPFLGLAFAGSLCACPSLLPPPAPPHHLPLASKSLPSAHEFSPIFKNKSKRKPSQKPKISLGALISSSYLPVCPLYRATHQEPLMPVVVKLVWFTCA